MAHSTILDYLLASFAPGTGGSDTEPVTRTGGDTSETDEPESEPSLSS